MMVGLVKPAPLQIVYFLKPGSNMCVFFGICKSQTVFPVLECYTILDIKCLGRNVLNVVFIGMSGPSFMDIPSEFRINISRMLYQRL